MFDTLKYSLLDQNIPFQTEAGMQMFPFCLTELELKIPLLTLLMTTAVS